MEPSRNPNFVEVPKFFFIVKVVQVFLSVLVLGLSAASIALEDGYGFYGGQGYAIFVCIATWISCGWYIASARFMPNLYHRIPALVLEIFLWIWWLSCWTMLAYWASWAAIFNDAFWNDGLYSVSGTALQAVLGLAAAIAAINWILVFTTAIVFVIHLMRFQRNSQPAAVTTQQAPKYEMQPQPQQYQQPQYEQQQSYPAQQPYQQPQYGAQPQYGQPQAQFDQSGEHKIAV